MCLMIVGRDISCEKGTNYCVVQALFSQYTATQLTSYCKQRKSKSIWRMNHCLFFLVFSCL